MTAGSRTTVLYLSLFTEFGGAEVGLLNLIRNLDRSRYDPVLLVNKEGPLSIEAAASGCRIVVVPFPVVMLKRLASPAILAAVTRSAFRIRRELAGTPVGILHCTDVLGLVLLLPLMVSLRVPALFGVTFFYERSRAFILSLLAPFGVKAVACLSMAVREEVKKNSFGLDEKCRLIYWGVDTALFRPVNAGEKQKLRRKLGLPEEKKVVGMIARYDTWKGHLTFLDAAGILLEKRPDLMFLLAGGVLTGESNPAVRGYAGAVRQRLSRADLRNRVLDLGHRSDIPEIMNVLDVCVCPSEREGFGLVVLESLSSGVPVVASRTVAAMEVIPESSCCLATEPGNPRMLAGAVERVLDGSVTAGEDQSVVAARKYNWKRMSDEYMVCYDRMIHGVINGN